MAGLPLTRGPHAFDHSSIIIHPGYQEEKDSWHVSSWMGQFSRDRTFSRLISSHAEDTVNLLDSTGERNERGEAARFSAFARAMGHVKSPLKLRPDFLGTGSIGSKEPFHCILIPILKWIPVPTEAEPLTSLPEKSRPTTI